MLRDWGGGSSLALPRILCRSPPDRLEVWCVPKEPSQELLGETVTHFSHNRLPHVVPQDCCTYVGGEGHA